MPNVSFESGKTTSDDTLVYIFVLSPSAKLHNAPFLGTLKALSVVANSLPCSCRVMILPVETNSGGAREISFTFTLPQF
jgi:hypothetical protein